MDYEIEARNLVKRFGGDGGWRSLLRPREQKLVIDDVSIKVRAGEIFGLLGPNGAGKTTLTKILAGLLLPDAGNAFVGGLDVAEHSLEVRQRIGLVYGDERSFFWRLSVYENLRFYAALYRLPRDLADRRIGELLDMVELSSVASVRMHRLSSGMKQRVSIARGLLNDPSILLLDEPTRMLDPIGAQETRRIVRERVSDGGKRTVLLATNLMAEAEELCDSAVLLKNGRIRLAGTIQELRESMQVEEMHILVVSGISKEVLDDLRNVPEIASVKVDHLTNGTYEVSLGMARGATVVPHVIRRIVDGGGLLWSSTPRELSLDEVFRLAVTENHSEDVADEPELAVAGGVR